MLQAVRRQGRRSLILELSVGWRASSKLGPQSYRQNHYDRDEHNLKWPTSSTLQFILIVAVRRDPLYFEKNRLLTDYLLFLVNPLTGEHILVSPQRSNRPWQGHTETPELITLPQHDPKCYLCPGNERASGQRNEIYEHTTVFVNDYPAILPPPGPIAPPAPHPLLTARPVDGQCDVITFHSRHDLTLARLGIEDIARIVEEWITIYKRRGTQEGIKYVQIFEVAIFLLLVLILSTKSVQNKGAIMGCSNPHPHGQVWSLSEVPTIASVELASLARHAVNSDIPPSHAPCGPFGRPCLLCEYVGFEVSVIESESRVVVKNEHFVALVPWWATWPFEILCKF